MLPSEREHEREKSLDGKTQNGLALRHKNDLFLQQNGLEYADNALQRQKLEDTVDGAFLL